MQLIQSIDKAIESGLITGAVFPVPAMDWEPPGLSSDIRKTLDCLNNVGPAIQITPITQQWDDPARDTRAQLYQDEGFYQEFDHGATDGQAYEIGRFRATSGECGFVKYIGTHIAISDGAGGYLELDFSNPFAMQDNGVNARFLLRFQPGTVREIGVAPWAGLVEHVPGYGYPELPFWDDYRFYWGRYANHVWFLVPRNHFLRLYIHVISGGGIIRRVLGRLQGYTQPVTTQGASQNVSHGW